MKTKIGKMFKAIVALLAIALAGATQASDPYRGKTYKMTDRWWDGGVLQEKEREYTLYWHIAAVEPKWKGEDAIYPEGAIGSWVKYDKTYRPGIRINGMTLPETTTRNLSRIDDKGHTAMFTYTVATYRYQDQAYLESRGYTLGQIAFISLDTPGAIYRISGSDTSGKVMINAKASCTIILEDGVNIGSPYDQRCVISQVSPIVCSGEEVTIINEGNAILVGNRYSPAIATFAGNFCNLYTPEGGGKLSAYGGKDAPAIGGADWFEDDSNQNIVPEREGRHYDFFGIFRTHATRGCGEINIYATLDAFVFNGNTKGMCAIGDATPGGEGYGPEVGYESFVNIRASDRTQVLANGAPAIGIPKQCSAGYLFQLSVEGGKLVAENRTGFDAPAIGAASNEWYSRGVHVYITGGEVKAGVYKKSGEATSSASRGPGIGRLADTRTPVSVRIDGGKVEAFGGVGSCGIGNVGEDKTTIDIRGGTVLSYGDAATSSQQDIAPVCVTGGSVKAARASGVYRDASTKCNRITVGGLEPNAKAEVFVSKSGVSYGENDIYADVNGMIYLWLPAADYGCNLFVNEEAYLADASKGDVVAQPLRVAYCTVTFDPCNPPGTPFEYDDIPKGAKFGVAYPVIPKSPDRGDYKFIGWYTTPSGDGTMLTLDTIITSDVTYYARRAKSAPEQCKVLFIDGEETVATIAGDKDSKYTMPEAPNKPGYEFLGWFLTPTGDGSPKKMPGDEVTFSRSIGWYARWKEVGGAANGYTWRYREDPEHSGCVEIYNVLDPNSAALSPDPTGAVEIPSALEGKLVTSIGEKAFYECKNMTSVVIPTTVERIGESAFYNCDALTSLEIPGSVKTIGPNAFYNCNALSTVTMGEGVETIGQGAFLSCPGLESLTIPDSVTLIDTAAFAFCDSLAYINMTDTGRRINSGAFWQCTALGRDNFVVVNGIMFQYLGSNNTIYVPDGVREIDDCAFMVDFLARTQFSTLVLPPESAVTFNGKSTFSDTGLTTVRLQFNPGSTTDMLDCRDSVKASLESTGYKKEVTYVLPDVDVLFTGEDIANSWATVPAGTRFGDIPAYLTKPTRPDYEFVCWTTIDGATVDPDALVRGNGVTCYAKWKYVLEYDLALVTFDANGGIVSPEARNVMVDAAVGELPTPTRDDGLVFDGWWTAANGGVEVTAETIVSADVTFYAHWKESSATTVLVTFDANGGKATSPFRPVEIGAEIGPLPGANFPGYTLIGWFTEQIYGAQVDEHYIVNAAQTLYAHWKENTTPPEPPAVPTLTIVTEGSGTTTPTGSGSYVAGKNVKLKAKAASGWVFSGWFRDGELISQAASYTYVMGLYDTTIVAKFVTLADDAAGVKADVEIGGYQAELVPNGTVDDLPQIHCGVNLRWSLGIAALSATSVKVSGLPAGLKFTAKNIYKKGSKVDVDIPMNTIYGVPTKPKEYWVKVTVTTAGKAKITYTFLMDVLSLSAYAVGQFDGYGENGPATLTVSAKGKISGKYLADGKTWKLSAPYFDSYNGSYTATVTGKSGKETFTGTLTMNWHDGIGTKSANLAGGAGIGDIGLYQTFWKFEEFKPISKLLKKETYGYAGGNTLGQEWDILLTMGSSNGSMKEAGVFNGTYKASGSATMIPLKMPDETSPGSRVYTGPFDALVPVYFPGNAKKGFSGYFEVLHLQWDGNKFEEIP